MTPADFAALCVAAKLRVLDSRTVGKLTCVTVAPLTVTPETVVRRLGRSVTLGFGDGTGNVELWFRRDG